MPTYNHDPRVLKILNFYECYGATNKLNSRIVTDDAMWPRTINRWWRIKIWASEGDEDVLVTLWLQPE